MKMIEKYCVDRGSEFIRNQHLTLEYFLNQNLNYAATNGHIDVVRWLLNEFAINLCIVCKAFHIACTHGQLEIAKLLFNRYDFPRGLFDKRTIRRAMHNQYYNILLWLMDIGIYDLINVI
jgi:ankyrin repeat protein